MKQQYDVVVVGAGSGGLTAAVGFRKVGKSVLLVEREHIGGECTNSGCIPSKALLHHAKSYRHALEVAGETSQSELFRAGAFAYVRERINHILAEETPETFQKLGIDVVLGEAVFITPCAVRVGENEYHYKHAVIATGSNPRPLSVPGLDEADVLTNQNLFALESAPEKLLIVGAGPIGLEMGQAFAMLGSQVTLATIDDTFARLEDASIQPILQESFATLGVTTLLSAHLVRIEQKVAVFEIRNGAIVVEEKRVTFDKILVAIGRVPNLPKGLDVAGITNDARGIMIDSQFRTSNKYVYATGDVALRFKFTHTADDTSRQIVAHVVSRGFLRTNQKKAVPKVTYTDPEVAQVGMSMKEAEQKYGSDGIIRVEVPFAHNDRAKTDSATTGVLVVIARRLHGTVLGAHIIGPAAGELISVFTLAIDQKVTLWSIQQTIFAYPTYALIIKKAADYFVGTQLVELKKDLIRVSKKSLPKILIALVWIIAVTQLYAYQQSQGLTVTETAFAVFDFVTMTVWGPLVYILAYTIRPLTFLPGTALTILSGVFFGFWTGTILTIIAANLSASVAYITGRFFGGNLKLEDSIIGNSVTALRNNTFSAVLTMRLVFLPFDLVSYAAGIIKTKFVPFIIATILGTLLGIATFVSVGASVDIESFRQNGITLDVIDANFVLLSVVVFVASLGLSKVLKRWQAKADA